MRGFSISAILALCAALAAVLPPAAACAAFRSSSDAVSPEQAWNPRPAPDDIILPMPCGLSLALRTVGVPAKDDGRKLINDRSFRMGVRQASEERELYERSFTGHIAAPFTLGDLPEAWRGHLPAGISDGYTFYFIGKYEISRLQWDAVMQALDANGAEQPQACPRPVAGANLPKGGLSWFDAQAFLQRYNAWLVKSQAAGLPRFEGTGNIGFARLPTEEEWEFAARGGAKVPPEVMDESESFPHEGKDLKDFGVFSGEEARSAPLPIGSRHPNPLGIYDTVGNVREMVDGFFHLSIAVADDEHSRPYRRLHGAAGGVLCKGGSYSSAGEAVLPGWRDEVPLYTAKGESRPADLGMRIALAGLNVPNSQRLQALKREGRAGPQVPGAGAPAAAAGAPATGDGVARWNRGATPLEALQKISDVAATPEMRANLAQLRALLRDQQSAHDRQRSDALEQIARSVLYQAETIRAFAYRYVTTGKTLKNIQGLQAKAAGAQRAQLEQMAGEARQDMEGYMQSLTVAAGYYKSCLRMLAGAEAGVVRQLLAQFRQEYGGNDVFNEHMRGNIATVDQHLQTLRAKGADGLSSRQILRDVVPERHLRALPLK